MFASKAMLPKKPDTRELLLKQGLTMLMTCGYEGASINAVLEAVNVPKGSFYHYFDSKESFCKEIIAYYQAEKMKECQVYLADAGLSPLNRIRAMLAHGIVQQQQSGFQCSCLLGVLGQEVAAQSESLRETIHDAYERILEYLLPSFEAARESGEIPPHVALRPLVASYMMTLQGALLEAKITRNAKPFKMLHWLFFTRIATPSEPLDEATEALFAL